MYFKVSLYFKYTRKFRQDQAHDDGIWCCCWGKFEKENSEIIVTGSVDDKIKIWSWSKENLELKRTCEGHQLGVVSVDMNNTGSNILLIFSQKLLKKIV